MALFVTAAVIPSVYAQSTTDFDIPALPLSEALLRFGQQAGVQLSVESTLVAGKQAVALHGSYTTADGLRQLLTGSGLAARVTGPNTIAIEGVSGTHVLGAVRVEGQATAPNYGVGSYGANGSTDVTATEGTGSLTTDQVYVGGMHSQSLLNVPQTVGVLTSQQLQDQALTDLNTALEQMPGIIVQQGLTSLEGNYYSRGFEITRTMIDGGISRNSQSGAFSYYGGVDLAPYDHVELLNGPDGFSNGYNSPAGTLNLVHKRALDHDQFTADLQVGAYDMWRAEADATGPVAFDGRVRARADIAKQDQNSWLDRAYTDRNVLFVTIEADLSSSTLLTVSNTYTQVDELPPGYSLPGYLSGASLDLPRSTCLCFPWATEDNTDRVLDASLQQKFGSDWDLKLSASRQRQSQVDNEPSLYGAINNYTGAGLVLSSAQQYQNAYTSTTGDMKTVGAFELFGRRQEVYIGANYEKDLGIGYTYSYDIPPAGIPFNVFSFNPYSISQPALSPSVYEYSSGGQKQYGANAGVTLSFIDPLKMMLGVRWQRFEQDDFISLPGIFSLGPSTPKDTYTGPSYGALLWTFNPQLTSYVSWADVLQSNFGDLEANGQTVAPTHGGTYEMGLKFKEPGSKLNSSVAIYYTDLKNVALYTGPGNGGDGFLSGCCYSASNNERELSYGSTFQIAGQLLPGWQAQFSWQYNVNRYTGSAAGAQQNQPLVSYQPRNSVKLWNDYTPQLPGWNRVNFGLGITAQSAQNDLGTACSQFAADPADGCAPNGTTPFVYGQHGYALVNLRLGYKLSQNWELTGNVDNLFNRTYWAEFLNSNLFFNQYGAPLTWKFGLHGKF